MKKSDTINSDKFNLNGLGFLFLPTRIAMKSIQSMQSNFSFQVALFVLIFSLFVIWQIFRQSYLLLNLFGWDWLSWLGFILTLIILFFVVIAGFNDIEEKAKKKYSVDEHFKQEEKSEKVEE